MKTLSQSIEIRAPVDVVFRHVDDIRNTGMHMTDSSMPMMGGGLALEALPPIASGVGATYRMHGKVMGMTIDFTETVTEWVRNRKRVWKTVGEPKLVIMGGYEMSFVIEPAPSGSTLTFGITYDLPASLFGRILGWLVGSWYARWCLRNMCRDAKEALERNPAQSETGADTGTLHYT